MGTVTDSSSTHTLIKDRCAAVQAKLDAHPRVRLGHLPTPLEPLDRLSEHLVGPHIWVKRDDCTGLSTGGNKTRKLEFLMAEAQQAARQCVLNALAAIAALGLTACAIPPQGVSTQNLAEFDAAVASIALTSSSQCAASPIGGRNTCRLPSRGSNAIARQALHAYRLTLPHPLDNQAITFQAPVPTDMVDAWLRLGGTWPPAPEEIALGPGAVAVDQTRVFEANQSVRVLPGTRFWLKS